MNPRLEAACLKALKKQPAERFASARDMRQALRAALSLAPETPTGTRVPVPPSPPAVRRGRPRPTWPSPRCPTVVMRRGRGGRPVLLGLAAVAVAGAAVFARVASPARAPRPTRSRPPWRPCACRR